MSDEITGIVIGIIVLIVIIAVLIRLTRSLIRHIKGSKRAHCVRVKAVDEIESNQESKPRKQRFSWFRERPKASILLAGILLLSIATVILIINIALPDRGEPAISQIVFTTSAQEIEIGVASVMIIQTEDVNGEPCSVKSDTIISLTTSCSTGHFENGNITITSVTIPSGSSSARFYYKDTALGSPTLIATELPSQGWIAASQQETIYWIGSNGESRIENVYWGEDKVVGADGHDIELVNNPQAVNPSGSALESFLRRDQTENTEYNVSTYSCADFAERLHNNAENAGITAAFVCISFGYFQYGHACNAFQTTDQGLIYIDDTGTLWGHSVDCTVNISEWHEYTPRSMFLEHNFEYDSMGIVNDFTITW